NDSAAAFAFFDFKAETVFGANLLGDLFVNRLIDVGEYAQLHQIGDDFEGLLLELFGEVPDDDRRFDGNDLAGNRRDKLRGGGGLDRLATRRRCNGATTAGRGRTPGRLEGAHTADIAPSGKFRPAGVRWASG